MNRSPDDWYANLELGIAASLTGHRAPGRGCRCSAPGDSIRREPIVRQVTRTFDAGRRIDSDAIDRAFARGGG